MENKRCASFILVMLMSMTVAAFVGCAKPSLAAPIVWKAAAISAEPLYTVQVMKWLSEQLVQKTNGRMKIEVYPGGSAPFKQDAYLSAVRDGLMEITEVWGSAVASEEKSLEIMGLPGFVSIDPARRELRVKLWREFTPVYEKILTTKQNCLSYIFSQVEGRNIYTSAPVNTLAEFKGKKIRTIGRIESDLTNKLGGVGVSLDAGEVSTALPRGMIDGYWIADTGVVTFKWYEISKYIINLRLGGAPFFICVNKTAYEALPKDVRKVFDELRPKATEMLYNMNFEQAAESRKTLLDKGMKEINWPKADTQKVLETAKEFWTTWYQAADSDAKSVFDKANSYIEKAGAR